MRIVLLPLMSQCALAFNRASHAAIVAITFPSWRLTGRAIDPVLPVALLTVLLLAGCASTDDKESLQEQISALKGKLGAYAPSLTNPASGTGSPVIAAAYTPVAPVTGGGMAVVGSAGGTLANPATTWLDRQANCSLTQYVARLENGTLAVTAIADLHIHLHQLAGLSTVPNVFPSGCQDRTQGVAGTSAVSLGKAPNGDYVGAWLNGSGNLSRIQGNPDRLATALPTVASLASGLGPGMTLNAADLNKDGLADLLVPNLSIGGQTGVGVFLRKTDGSLEPAAIYPLTLNGESGSAATIEDMDGDGDLDIVVLTQPAGWVATLANDGHGGFAFGPAPVDVFGGGTLVSADFNGDGHKDVLTGHGVLLTGRGDGTFDSPTHPFADFGFSGGELATGDFNRDGKQDVAAKVPDMLSIFLGQGDGSFTARVAYGTALGADHIGITDIDGDGNADIVVGLLGPGLYVPDEDSATVIQFLMGHGDGSFVGAPATSRQSFQDGFAVADFNGDGRSDLVRAGLPAGAPLGGRLELRLFPAKASGAFGSALSPTPIAFESASHMASGDVNGDGKTDLIVAGAGYTPASPFASVPLATVFLGNGAGAFSVKQTLVFSAEPSIETGDFNGDGRTDLVFSIPDLSSPSGNSRVVVYLSATDGMLKPSILDEISRAGLVTAGDLNDDGHADLLLAIKGGTSTDIIGVRLGRADGHFVAASPVNGVDGIDTLGLADINQDGKLDLVAGAEGSGKGRVVVWPGSGNGGFLAPVSNDLPGGENDFTRALTMGDFNRDGHPDVLVSRNYYSQYLFGNGDGTLPRAVGLTLASRASSLVTADVNGDGWADAVAEVSGGVINLVNQPSSVELPAPNPQSTPTPTPTPTPIVAPSLPPSPSEPYLTLLSPNGGETLSAGSKYLIRWTSGNLARRRALNLYFLKSQNARPRLLKSRLKLNGLYRWKPLKKDATIGGFIKLCTVKAKKSPALCDMSDKAFSVEKRKKRGLENR